MKYIITYRETSGISPSFREIAERFEISLHTAQEITGCIRKKGLIAWEASKARTIKVVLPPLQNSHLV
jgi:transposase